MRIYLDHNATTPMAPAVRAAMTRALELTGNPSSIHAEGREARDAVEGARAQVAALLGAADHQIVFTGGGTEADLLGVIGLARAARGLGRPPRVLTTAIEHPAVHGAATHLKAEGFEVVHVPVDARGVLDLGALESACARGAAALAVSLANHELGTVQDLAAASRVAERHGVLVHCDAVQAAGKMALEVEHLGASTLAISAHKLHGPKGVGALWVRADLDLPPLFEAGHQERARRPGTENVPGIVGLGEAARLACHEPERRAVRVAALAALLERGLLALEGVRIHGAGAPRVGNTVSAGFDGALGETLVTALDLAGVAASTGAACTSGTVTPSPVLLATGLAPERAVEAVRFSLGPDNTEEEVKVVLEILPSILLRSRKFR